MAHGACAHEAVHQYFLPGSVGVTVTDRSRDVVSPGFGVVTVNDSETGDCDGDGVALDFDGDLDFGIGGVVFGHGPWAEHCGFHFETAGTVTVTDLVFAQRVSFVQGSDDANGFLFDPETGENTCITDGLISPETDLEGDDCLSPPSSGTQPITCPGGGDGLLWVFISGLECSQMVIPRPPPLAQTRCDANPAIVGTVTSP